MKYENSTHKINIQQDKLKTRGLINSFKGFHMEKLSLNSFIGEFLKF